MVLFITPLFLDAIPFSKIPSKNLTFPKKLIFPKTLALAIVEKPRKEMEINRRVMCLENEELTSYLLQKRQELADKPKGIKENTDMTLSKAYNNICKAQHPIKTLKDLNDIKGIWEMDSGAYAWLFRKWFRKF